MTIRELARLAGVSHATVSRALNDNPRLSLKTRERIQALAKKHEYQPHPLVSKLMVQLAHIKTINRSTLALVTSFKDPLSPFLLEVYEGIKERVKVLGYKLEEFPLSAYKMSCSRLSDVLYARGIEGVIIFPLQKSPGHLSLKWPRFTSVAIGRTLACPPLHRVSFSHFENMVLALRHMHKLGYQRIAMAIESRLHSRGGDAYIAAFCLYQRTIPQKDRVPILVRPVIHAAETADWLRKYRADSILCNYSPTPRQLKSEGFDIPGRLGYVTLDRYPGSDHVTGIEQNPRYVGVAAVDQLTAHLHRNERGIPPFPKLTVIQGEWIEAKTVKKLSPHTHLRHVQKIE